MSPNFKVERQFAYYAGIGLVILGFFALLSAFFRGRIGDEHLNVLGLERDDVRTAVGGVVLMIFGVFMRGFGARGFREALDASEERRQRSVDHSA